MIRYVETEGRRPGGGRRRWCVLVVAGGMEPDFWWIRREHLGNAVAAAATGQPIRMDAAGVWEKELS